MTCTHYWVCDQPSPGGVRGECKYCHAVRIFPASFEQYGFTEGATLNAEPKLTVQGKRWGPA